MFSHDPLLLYIVFSVHQWLRPLFYILKQHVEADGQIPTSFSLLTCDAVFTCELDPIDQFLHHQHHLETLAPD